jgi:chlorite dismutase
MHTGQPQELHSRLFMTLQVFTSDSRSDGASTLPRFADAIESQKMPAVIYEDVNDARGLAVLSWSEDPAHFVTRLRPALQAASSGMRQRQEFSMLGRTYATGYESDLRFWLLERPRQTALNPEWPWAVWYPLRRIGSFGRLEGRERGAIMSEHGKIGRAYGAQDLVHDIRLACYGLDTNDNEFVIGLVGRELHPLSHVVEAMRRTRQTAEFMQQMGPFFVGHAALRVG